MSKADRVICKHVWKKTKQPKFKGETLSPPPKDFGLKFGPMKRCIVCGSIDIQLVKS